MTNNAIEEMAEKLLRDSNLLKLPIDPLICTKFLEIDINSVDLDDNISGFLAIKNKTAQIGYNKNHGKERQRFTIAHELGHYLLHSQTNEPLFIDKTQTNNISTFLFRDESSSSGEFIKEREANSFAAALLMPKNLLKLEIESSQNKNNVDNLVNELAKKFKVSKQAMSIRLSRLNYFDYDSAYN